MTEVKIKFSSSAGVNEVKELVSVATLCKYDVDVVCGRYVVDAKSIMGWFSLDLSAPLMLRVHSDSCDEVLAQFDRFIEK